MEAADADRSATVSTPAVHPVASTKKKKKKKKKKKNQLRTADMPPKCPESISPDAKLAPSSDSETSLTSEDVATTVKDLQQKRLLALKSYQEEKARRVAAEAAADDATASTAQLRQRLAAAEADTTLLRAQLEAVEPVAVRGVTPTETEHANTTRESSIVDMDGISGQSAEKNDETSRLREEVARLRREIARPENEALYLGPLMDKNTVQSDAVSSSNCQREQVPNGAAICEDISALCSEPDGLEGQVTELSTEFSNMREGAKKMREVAGTSAQEVEPAKEALDARVLSLSTDLKSLHMQLAETKASLEERTRNMTETAEREKAAVMRAQILQATVDRMKGETESAEAEKEKCKKTAQYLTTQLRCENALRLAAEEQLRASQEDAREARNEAQQAQVSLRERLEASRSPAAMTSRNGVANRENQMNTFFESEISSLGLQCTGLAFGLSWWSADLATYQRMAELPGQDHGRSNGTESHETPSPELTNTSIAASPVSQLVSQARGVEPDASVGNMGDALRNATSRCETLEGVVRDKLNLLEELSGQLSESSTMCEALLATVQEQEDTIERMANRGVSVQT